MPSKLSKVLVQPAELSLVVRNLQLFSLLTGNSQRLQSAIRFPLSPFRTTTGCGWRIPEPRRSRSFAIRASGFVAVHQPAALGTRKAEEARLGRHSNPFGGVLDGRRSDSAASVALPATVPEPGFMTLPLT